MISFKLQNLYFSDIINDLLCQIDVKIAKISENKLNSSRYGAKICIDYDTYYILNKYKYILKEKANNSRCLSLYSVDDIISNIKQYLTSGKPQKFKQLTDSYDTPISQVEPKNISRVEMIYKHYGNNVINNFIGNRYVTETVQDNWDQNDW